MKDSALTAWEITRTYLKKRRDELEMSNYRLAQEADVPESTVHRVLNGERIPSIVLVLKIAKVMGLRIKLTSR